jgi:hypothetical protein
MYAFYMHHLGHTKSSFQSDRIYGRGIEDVGHPFLSLAIAETPR